MNDVLKDLYASMKGKMSVFNFLGDEDIENLSAFFESKNIHAGESLWGKKRGPFRLYSYYCFRKGGNKKRGGVRGHECDYGQI